MKHESAQSPPTELPSEVPIQTTEDIIGALFDLTIDTEKPPLNEHAAAELRRRMPNLSLGDLDLNKYAHGVPLSIYLAIFAVHEGIISTFTKQLLSIPSIDWNLPITIQGQYQGGTLLSLYLFTAQENNVTALELLKDIIDHENIKWDQIDESDMPSKGTTPFHYLLNIIIKHKRIDLIPNLIDLLKRNKLNWNAPVIGIDHTTVRNGTELMPGTTPLHLLLGSFRVTTKFSPLLEKVALIPHLNWNAAINSVNDENHGQTPAHFIASALRKLSKESIQRIFGNQTIDWNAELLGNGSDHGVTPLALLAFIAFDSLELLLENRLVDELLFDLEFEKTKTLKSMLTVQQQATLAFWISLNQARLLYHNMTNDSTGLEQHLVETAELAEKAFAAGYTKAYLLMVNHCELFKDPVGCEHYATLIPPESEFYEQAQEALTNTLLNNVPAHISHSPDETAETHFDVKAANQQRRQYLLKAFKSASHLNKNTRAAEDYCKAIAFQYVYGSGFKQQPSTADTAWMSTIKDTPTAFKTVLDLYRERNKYQKRLQRLEAKVEKSSEENRGLKKIKR